MEIWTIYKHPRDYPEHYVARLWLWGDPTERVLTAETLEEIRTLIPRGLVRLNRMPDDDPAIVETWF
jgi:hypothetical protein